MKFNSIQNRPLLRSGYFAAALLGLMIPALGMAEDKPNAKPAPYPLSYCVISGEKLGSMGDPVVVVLEGREIKLCCSNCSDELKTNPAATLKKIDEAIIKAQSASYPTDKCLVSGKELGKMGKPVDIVVENRLVRLCCNGCPKQVQGDPAKFLAKLDEAVIAKEMKDYPLNTCVVSDHDLDSMDKPVNKVYAGHLVRFCCEGCIKDFDKDPAKYAAKVEAAREKAKAPATK